MLTRDTPLLTSSPLRALPLWLWLLAALLLVAGCGNDKPGGGDNTPQVDCSVQLCVCSFNQDCPLGFSCVGGRCQTGSAPEDMGMEDTGADMSTPDVTEDMGDTGEPDLIEDTGEPDLIEDMEEPDLVEDMSDSGDPDLVEDTGEPDLVEDMEEPDLVEDITEPDMADMDGVCVDDNREPNDDRRDASPLGSNRQARAVLCPENQDWFLLELDEIRRRMVIVVETEGNLRGTLRTTLAPDTPIASLVETEDGWGLDWTPEPGQYFLLLESRQEEPLNYGLRYDTPALPCDDDMDEPNNTREAAAALDPDDNPFARTICEGNVDWYAVEIGGHMRIDVTVDYDQEEVGDLIRAALFDPQGELLTQTNANLDSFFFLIDGDQGGTYFLRIDSTRAQGPYEMDVTLSFDQCEDDDLEPNDNSGTAHAIDSGFQAQGAELCQNNIDWYAIEAEARQTIRAELALEFPLSDISADIIGPDGVTIISQFEDTQPGNIATAVTAQAGTHYVRIFSPNSNRSTYDLSVTLDACYVDDLEPNNLAEQASQLRANTVYPLRVCQDDSDWFSFPQVPADHHVDLAIQPEGEGGRLLIDWFDAQDLEAPIQQDSLLVPLGSTLRLTNQGQARDLLVRVRADRSDLGYSLTTQVVPVFVCQVDDLEPNNSLADAVMDLSAPGIYPDLSVCQGDFDFLCFMVPPQETITATASFVHAEGDLELQLLTEQNTPLAASATDQDEESVSWRNLGAQPALACAFVVAQRFSPMVQNRYNLEVQVSGVANVCNDDSREDNDGPQAATLLEDRRSSPFNPIPLGQIFSNPEDQPAITALRGLVLCDEDPDWFTFEGQVGDTLEVDLSFAHANGDLALTLYRAEGLEQIATVNTPSDDEALTVTLPAEDTYFLAITGQDIQAQSYDLEVDLRGACVEDGGEPNDMFFNATPVIPGAYEGRGLCAGGDVDYYAINLGPGDTLEASTFYSPWRVDIDMELFDPNQNFLARSADSGGRDRVTWTARQAGTHYLRIYPFGNDPVGASATYDLDLVVTPSPTECTPDAFEGEQEAPRVSLAGGLAEINNLTLCQQDVDSFSFVLLEAQDLEITASVPATIPESALRLTTPGGETLRGVGAPEGYLLRSLNAQPGLYTLRVSRGGLAPVQVPYSVRIQGQPVACANDLFEPNQTRGQAPGLSPGVWHDLTLCDTERDCFQINSAGQERLRLQASFVHSQGDLDLSLFGPGDELVASAAGIDNVETLDTTLEEAGLYLVCVTSATNQGAQRYDLSLERGAGCLPDLLEPNQSADQAAAFPEGALVSMTTCGQEDWVRVTGVAGQELSASLSDASEGLDLDLRVLDAQGQELGSSQSEGSSQEQVNALLSAGGDFFVGVLNPAQAQGRYDLRVELRDRPAPCVPDINEPNNSPEQAAEISPGASVDASMCDGADYYRVTLSPHQEVEVEAAFLNSRGALRVDVLEADGGSLLQTGRRSFNSSVATLARGDEQPVLIRVLPVDGYRDAYTLRVRDLQQRQLCSLDQGEPDGDLAGATLLASGGGARRGALCSDERDLFRLDLDAGDHLEAALRWPEGAAPLSLSLLTTDQQTLTSDDSGGDGQPRALVGATLDTGGTYLLAVTGMPQGESPYWITWRVLGAYSCAVDDLDPNDSQEAARALAPGLYTDLEICDQDEDWYALDLEAGAQLEVNLAHPAQGADVDLELYDAQGALLASSRTLGGRESLRYSAPAQGSAYLRVLAPGRGATTYDMDVSLLDEP